MLRASCCAIQDSSLSSSGSSPSCTRAHSSLLAGSPRAGRWLHTIRGHLQPARPAPQSATAEQHTQQTPASMPLNAAQRTLSGSRTSMSAAVLPKTPALAPLLLVPMKAVRSLPSSSNSSSDASLSGLGGGWLAASGARPEPATGCRSPRLHQLLTRQAQADGGGQVWLRLAGTLCPQACHVCRQQPAVQWPRAPDRPLCRWQRTFVASPCCRPPATRACSRAWHEAAHPRPEAHSPGVARQSAASPASPWPSCTAHARSPAARAWPHPAPCRVHGIALAPLTRPGDAGRSWGRGPWIVLFQRQQAAWQTSRGGQAALHHRLLLLLPLQPAAAPCRVGRHTGAPDCGCVRDDKASCRFVCLWRGLWGQRRLLCRQGRLPRGCCSSACGPATLPREVPRLRACLRRQPAWWWLQRLCFVVAVRPHGDGLQRAPASLRR